MWQEQMVAAPLADAVGKFAVRGGDAPAWALTTDEVDALMATLAASSATVRSRNVAMVTLMLHAGLRVGEVITLRLDDIDWRAGLLRVRGKGACVDQVPLPVDVGRALVDYLQDLRPRTSTHREVFLSSCAPHAALCRNAVTLMVSKALRRAGIEGPGAAHRLRHTAACRVLASGGGLIEAGQLLRHRSLGVTAIYAKANLVALRPLARPWPTARVAS
jgi:site-specific recombinase XerD